MEERRFMKPTYEELEAENERLKCELEDESRADIEVAEIVKKYEADVERLKLALDCELGVRAMTVTRLGGIVEGQPTHTGNFLQRIDELLRKEAAIAEKDATLEAVNAMAVLGNLRDMVQKARKAGHE